MPQIVFCDARRAENLELFNLHPLVLHIAFPTLANSTQLQLVSRNCCHFFVIVSVENVDLATKPGLPLLRLRSHAYCAFHQCVLRIDGAGAILEPQ